MKSREPGGEAQLENLEGGMRGFESGDVVVRLSGFDLLPGGSQRDAQGRRRILGSGALRDLSAHDLGWSYTPGAFSLRSVSLDLAETHPCHDWRGRETARRFLNGLTAAQT